MKDTLPLAYSQLPEVLTKARLKISELQQMLKEAGVHVNSKSLYRLTSMAPLQKIDTRIIGAICHTCDVGIEDLIGFERPRTALQKLGVGEQKRLDELLDKQREGRLARTEAEELETLCEKAHNLTMANARLLVARRKSLKTGRPSPKQGRRAK